MVRALTASQNRTGHEVSVATVLDPEAVQHPVSEPAGGDQGLLPWINAPKLNRLFEAFVGGLANLARIKERLGFG